MQGLRSTPLPARIFRGPPVPAIVLVRSDMRLRLFDWGPSPFCMKIRMLLEHKGLEFERLMIWGPPLVELWRRGRIGKVPALEIDGELVCDSTDIAYAIEERCPTPPAIPSDPVARGRCHVIEDWADESMYFLNLYYQWLDPEGAPNVAKAFAKVPLGQAIVPIFRQRVARQVRGQGTGRKPPEHIRRDLERNLDALDGMLAGGGFLLGDAPLLCDFAVAAQLHYLGRTPVGGRALAEHAPIRAYMERMKSLRETTRAQMREPGARVAST